MQCVSAVYPLQKTIRNTNKNFQVTLHLDILRMAWTRNPADFYHISLGDYSSLQFYIS